MVPDPTLISLLDHLQDRIHDWRKKNFPEGNEDQQLLGVVEELGELCHARLKSIQRIREGASVAGTIVHERDAIGDLLIYLMGYCSYQGLSMADCLKEAWAEVEERDWVMFPNDGKSR